MRFSRRTASATLRSLRCAAAALSADPPRTKDQGPRTKNQELSSIDRRRRKRDGFLLQHRGAEPERDNRGHQGQRAAPVERWCPAAEPLVQPRRDSSSDEGGEALCRVHHAVVRRGAACAEIVADDGGEQREHFAPCEECEDEREREPGAREPSERQYEQQ